MTKGLKLELMSRNLKTQEDVERQLSDSSEVHAGLRAAFALLRALFSFFFPFEFQHRCVFCCKATRLLQVREAESWQVLSLKSFSHKNEKVVNFLFRQPSKSQQTAIKQPKFNLIKRNSTLAEFHSNQGCLLAIEIW